MEELSIIIPIFNEQKSNKKFRTYSKEDRDKYCKECIEPNGTDVLGQYAEFFIGKLKN